MNRYLWIAAAVAAIVVLAVVVINDRLDSNWRMQDLRLSLEIAEQELQEAKLLSRAASDAAGEAEALRIQERGEMSAKIRDMEAAVQIAESGRRRSETRRRELEAELARDIERLPELPPAELVEAATLLMRELYPALPGPEILFNPASGKTELDKVAAVGMQSALVEVGSLRQREGLLLGELRYSGQIQATQEHMIEAQRQEIAAERLRGDRWQAAWEARGHEIERHEMRGTLQEALIGEYRRRDRRRKLTMAAVGVAAAAIVVLTR